MSQPLQTQLYNALLGVQQGVGRLLLPDIHSSGGSYNVWADKIGRLRRAFGFERTHSEALIPPSSIPSPTAPTTAVLGMYFYSSVATGVPNGYTYRFIVVVTRTVDVGGTAIWSSADEGVTWSLLFDEYVGSATYPIVDFAQVGNTLYIATGGNTTSSNFTFDGSSGTAVLAAVTATQSPTPSASSTGTGVLNGTYQWKLVSINATTGARKAASVASSVLTLTDTQAALTWTADADTAQGGYELYRTTGTGKVFYFVTYIDGRTTAAYTDNTPDTDVFQNRVMEEHGDIPPGYPFVEAHKGRLWWLGATRGYWSDAGLPTSVYAENFLNFTDADMMGDYITGGVGGFNDSLAVFTQQTVYMVSGTGAFVGRIADWTRRRSSVRTGSVSHRSAVKVPVGARYLDAEGTTQVTTSPMLAYWTPLMDIRLFDGQSDTIISLPVRDELAQANYASRHWIHAAHDVPNAQIIWFYPGTGKTYPSQAVIWNYQWGIWTTLTHTPFTASVRADTSTAAFRIYTALTGDVARDAFVCRFFESDLTTNDGAPFTAQWTTKPLFGSDENGFPLVSLTKRWRWADTHVTLDSDTVLSVSWFDGNDGPDGSPIDTATVSAPFNALMSADGEPLVSAAGDPIGTTSASVSTKSRLADTGGNYLHSPAVRLVVADDGSGADWALDGITLAYQVLPGQKRRMDE